MGAVISLNSWQLSPFVEHLLRRAGFGASEAEREQFSRYTYPIAVSILTNFNPAETDVDDRINTSGYVQVAPPGRAFSPNTVLADARSAGCSGWCIRRRRCRRRWRSSGTITSRRPSARSPASSAPSTATRLMAAKPSQDVTAQRGPDRAVPAVRARGFQPAAGRGRAGPGDALLARRHQQSPRRAAGELRPRADGALHVRRRALRRDRTSTPRRACSPAGTFCRPARAARQRELRVPLHVRQPRHRRERVQLSDLSRRQPPDSGAQRGRRACRTGSISSPRWRGIRKPRGGWPAGCGPGSSARPKRPIPAFVDEISGVYLANDTSMKPVIRAVLLSRQFTDPARSTSATAGRSSSWCGR